MASWVSARLPATSTILIVTGLVGSAGTWAPTGPQPRQNAMAPSTAAANCPAARWGALRVRFHSLLELMGFLLKGGCRLEAGADPRRCRCVAAVRATVHEGEHSAAGPAPGRRGRAAMPPRLRFTVFQ